MANYIAINRRDLVKALSIAPIFCNASYSYAKQVSFSKNLVDNHYLLNFQYIDIYGRAVNFSFYVDKNASQNSVFYDIYHQKFQDRQHEIHKKSLKSQYGPGSQFASEVSKLESKYPGLDVMPEIRDVKFSYKYRLPYGINSADMRLIRRTLAKVNSEASKRVQSDINRVFREFGYRIESETRDGFNLRVDYEQFIRKERAFLKQLADQIVHTSVDRSTKSIVNNTLSFLQSIPYDQLLDRSTSNGSSFNPPLQMLLNNRGDCDSKSCAFWAIIKNVDSNIRGAFILTARHALIGLEVDAEHGDAAITYEGQRYVLAEPTGPRKAKLGKISDLSKSELRTGRGVQVFRI